MKTIRQVLEFHEAFGIDSPREQTMPVAKTKVNREYEEEQLCLVAMALNDIGEELLEQAQKGKSVRLLRLQLIVEEVSELAAALYGRDMAESLDALCDIRYVVDGTTLALGLAPVFGKAFDEVHASNMSKLDVDGKPIIGKSGRVQKPAHFVKPNLKKFITVKCHAD